VVKASERKLIAQEVVEKKMSIASACRTSLISETCYRYTPKLSVENEKIADLFLGLTQNQRNWRFSLCFLHLRNVQGYGWNRKRVYRIYRELSLHLRIKPNKRLNREVPLLLALPEKENECWSMDFMHDQLADGHSCGRFNVINNFNREGLIIDADISLPAERVIRSVDQIIEWKGKPKAIKCDNSPEYISQKLADWAEKNGITLLFIQPGNPQQNAYIERFNRTVRYDWLSHYIYAEIEELKDRATSWLWTYNNERPNTGMGGTTPIQKRRLTKTMNSTPELH